MKTMIILDSLSVDTASSVIISQESINNLSSEGMLYVIAIAIVTVYEVCARIIPTTKDISILSKIVGFISMIIPNLKKSGGKH